MSAPPLLVSVSGSPPTVTVSQPDEAADHDTHAEEHDVRLAGRTFDVAQRRAGALHIPLGAAEPENVSPVDDRVGDEGNLLATADQFREDDASPVSLAQHLERLLRRLSFRHDHVERGHRKAEKLGVLEFLSERQLPTEQHPSPCPDGHDVARLQNGVRSAIDQLRPPPDAFHEDPIGAAAAFEIRDGPACRGVRRCRNARMLHSL